MNKYDFFPNVCPSCGQTLVIEEGKQENTLRLICKNKKCDGVRIKTLQRGFGVLGLKNIGPAVVEKFYDFGITNIVDVFDKEFFNEESLIDSEIFKKGKSLSNILKSIENFKMISIEKAIEAFQIQIQKEDNSGFVSIGKALSLEIGKMLSGIPSDFLGLSKQIRENLKKENSYILSMIVENLTLMENNGIIINKIELKKKKEVVKSISKTVFVSSLVNQEFPSKLDWVFSAELNKKCDLVIVDNKKEDTFFIAKDNNIKVITYKQAKLLFF